MLEYSSGTQANYIADYSIEIRTIVNGLRQDFGMTFADTMEILQSWIEPLKYYTFLVITSLLLAVQLTIFQHWFR